MEKEDNQAIVGKIIRAAYVDHKPLAWFEELYRTAKETGLQIPWANFKRNENLDLSENLLDFIPTKKVLVIGCGLGDDAEYLSDCGGKVDAFDLSETAIEMCKKRFPNSKVNYFQADLFALPESMKGHYDFIFEAYTLQAMPTDYRDKGIIVIPDLLSKNGFLYMICRGRDHHEEISRLPFPISKEELEPFKVKVKEILFEDFHDQEDPPKRRFRILYQNS